MHITTDYSESLIELVTPAFTTSWELLQYLLDLHQFVYRHLGDELLWATSMPGAIERDEDIPDRPVRQLARRTDEDDLPARAGAALRPDDAGHLRRAFQLLVSAAVLGGLRGLSASRATAARTSSRRAISTCCATTGATAGSCCICSACRRWSASRFCKGRDFELPEFTNNTAYEPYATSLRMSDVGYRNRNQAGLAVSVNSLEEYVRDLTHAISTPHPPYEALGVKVDGEYRQLNANILQIENEYYSFIRPKRVARSGERPTKALQRAGVEYVEVRALDVSAFDPVGVNQNKLRFLEAFLALCLLKDSPPIGESEQAASRSEPHHRGAAWPRAWPHVVARRTHRADACLGAGAARLDDGHLRSPGSRRCVATLLAGAGGPGGQSSRMSALTPSARLMEELTTHGRIVLRPGVTYVRDT